MKVKMKTVLLKEMVGRAVKGAGNNKLLPLTGMMCVSVQNNQMKLITSDGSNYFYILQDKVETDEDFYVVVQAEQFSKLISRMTCDSVEMTVQANALEVKGNGVYRIDIPLDEEGEFITYPDPFESVRNDITPEKQIQLSTIKTILAACKNSLAQTLEVPCYTGYYCGERVVTTDSNKMASMQVNLFDDTVLVPPEVMNLLDVMTAENIDVNVTDQYLVFTTPDCIVIGRPMDGVEDYPIVPITELLENGMPSQCKINRNEILSLLDRIALFVGPYDDKAIRLTFAEDGVHIESMQSNGVEVIDYISSDNHKPFTCLIDITFLLDEMKSIQSDTVQIEYGTENALKFIDGNVTLLIALMADNAV